MLFQNFRAVFSSSNCLKTLRPVFAALLACLSLGAAENFAQNGNTPQRQNGKIAYEGAGAHIFTINPDGSNNTDVSGSAPAGDHNPYFSWDGKKIYFRSFRDDYGYGEIYVMNANGSNQTRLSYNLPDGFNPCPLDASPAVSPDGTKVIFMAYGNGGSVIREMSASGYTNMTNNCNGQPPMIAANYNAFLPSYSPDGTKIIFDGFLRGGSNTRRNIQVRNADGTVAQLTHDSVSPLQNLDAKFSPDGTKIVYLRYDGSRNDIYVMNADGSNSTKLTTDGLITSASWSPDGAKIAFVMNYQIYTMDANGANKTLVPNAATSETTFRVSWGASPYVSVTPAQNVNLQFSNVTSGGNTTASPITPTSPPQSYTFPSGAPAYDITTTASFSGTIDVTMQVQNVASASDCSKLRILHYTNNAWDDSGNAAPQYNAGTMVCTLTQTVSSLSPFAVAQVLAPTAAVVNISGRVINGKRGIRNALVTLTEQDGTTRTVLTGASGSYSFEEVAAGQTVIVSVRAKRITFSQPTQIFTVTEDFTGVNFYAIENYLSNLGW